MISKYSISKEIKKFIVHLNTFSHRLLFVINERCTRFKRIRKLLNMMKIKQVVSDKRGVLTNIRFTKAKQYKRTIINEIIKKELGRRRLFNLIKKHNAYKNTINITSLSYILFLTDIKLIREAKALGMPTIALTLNINRFITYPIFFNNTFLFFYIIDKLIKRWRRRLYIS